MDGSDDILQNLQQTLQLWLGEWFLDTTVGIPYRQQILVKSPNLDVIQADLVNAALDVPGVTSIVDYSVNFDSTGRSLTVSMSVQDSNGQTITAQASISQPIQPSIQGTPT